MDHKWPKADEHLFGPWMQKGRADVPPGATQYRICIHPDCLVFEERPAPRG